MNLRLLSSGFFFPFTNVAYLLHRLSLLIVISFGILFFHSCGGKTTKNQDVNLKKFLDEIFIFY
jgi:hypothetical protein